MSDQIKALIEELRARRGIASIQNARLMERAADALEALSHMEEIQQDKGSSQGGCAIPSSPSNGDPQRRDDP